jgi:hypothetical protein
VSVSVKAAIMFAETCSTKPKAELNVLLYKLTATIVCC